MDRVLSSTPAVASVQYYEDGAAVDPGVVTVTVTRDDGTALYTDAATGGTLTAARTYALTATDTSSLDFLTLTWTSATKGTRVTYVEVVGGFLASITEIRAESPLSNTTTYPAASVIAARTVAEQALEDACGVAFVPRYARETRNGNGSTDILPFKPKPISITSATVDSTDVTADVVVDQERGTFYYESGWGSTRQGVVLKYVAGHTFPPGNCAKVVAKLVRWLLIDSPMSDRAVNLVTDEGSQFFVTAGVRGAIFDIPQANAFVDAYGVNVNVA